MARKPLIIAITGSAGKTTTTEVIANVLSDPEAEKLVGKVGHTVNNLNVDVDLLGILLLRNDGSFLIPWNYIDRIVFLCLLPMQALRVAFGTYPRIWIIECGICTMSDLHWQAALLRPNVAVVTTIGAAHLEKFGTIEGVLHEKGALIRAVETPGLVVLGQEHDYVMHLERMARVPVVRVSGQGVALSKNIAQAICRHLGVSDDIATKALERFKNPPGRLNQLDLNGMTVIDDSFNANPLSMKLGLDTLAQIGQGRRRVAILGSMAELGSDEISYHREVGSYAKIKAEIIIGVGDLAREYNPDSWFPTSDACADEIKRLVRLGDCIFVKGSGSSRMGRVVTSLREL